MAPALSILSPNDTKSDASALLGNAARYACLRDLHSGLGACVRAIGYDFRYVRPETTADVFEPHFAALVLRSIAEQSSNGLDLVAAVAEHPAAHAEEMSDVGNGGPLPLLHAVDTGGVTQCFLEWP